MSGSITSVCAGLVVLAGAGMAGALVSVAQRHRRPYLPGAALTVDEGVRYPIRTALRSGYAAVEIPVCLADPGSLVVGAGRHPELWRGLRPLVLDPLQARASRTGGRIHRGQTEPLVLLLHLRPNPELGDPAVQAYQAYQLLDQLLRGYPGLATRWTRGRIELGPVTVLLTGAHWSGAELLAGRDDRLVFLDGTFADLGDLSPAVMPLVSEDWDWRFGWDGSEAMPPEERHLLRALVGQAHLEGRGVRVTGGPTANRRVRGLYWQELVLAGVDLVGTGRHRALGRFLRGWQAPATPLDATQPDATALHTADVREADAAGVPDAFAGQAVPDRS